MSLYDEILAKVHAHVVEDWEVRMHEWELAQWEAPGCICYCSGDCAVHPGDPCTCPPSEKSDACYEHGTVKGWWLAKEATLTHGAG